MISRLRMAIPRWSDFRRLGHSAVLRSSYVWVIVVPAVSKILAAVGQDTALPVWIASTRLHLGLPFSLKIFYYSSFAFACGSLLYSLRCPRIVRDYERFSEWSDEGRGSRQIVREYLYLIFRPGVSAGVQEQALFHFGETLGAPIPTSLTYPEGTTHHIDRERVFEIPLPAGRNADAFWYVRDFADVLYPITRLIAAVVYALGFALLAALVVHNFRYVWRYTF